MILDQEELILLKLLVDVLLSGEQQFVGGFGDFGEEEDGFIVGNKRTIWIP